MLPPLQRRVEPELLDELPADNPGAIRSRRDLERINVWMGNVGILRLCLERAFAGGKPRTLVEIGAGDGTFLLKVARKLHLAWGPGVNVTLVDRQEVVRPETIQGFEALGWAATKVRLDVFDWLERLAPATDAIVANLFLHHFTADQLQRLLAAASQRAPFFAAVEPRRARGSLVAGHLLWAIGCNDVTRHDALVSIRAGFAGQEISRLWPRAAGWQLSERPINLASHLFLARGEMTRPGAASNGAGA